MHDNNFVKIVAYLPILEVIPESNLNISEASVTHVWKRAIT